MDIEQTALWVIDVDRRLITIKAFVKEKILHPSEIAKESHRSIQNISRALHELEKQGIVKGIDEKKSWKKYILTEKGKKVLNEIEKNIQLKKPMKIFYGAAIQGAENRKKRSKIHQVFIDTIKEQGFEVYTEHTTGKSYGEAIEKLERSIGPIPKKDIDRRIYVRNKMIEGIEGNILAAVFEVSTPSLGTGVEIAHAYLRPRIGLSTIPILALYEKDYWPNKLSTMIRGISDKELPYFILKEYENIGDVKKIIYEFLTKYAKE